MRYFLAALLTAVLASVSWPANGSLTPLIFVAFVPVLWLEHSIRNANANRRGWKVFLYAWLTFGLFNLFTTWWVAYAHWSGTAATTFINGFLMAFVFWLYHLVARGIGSARAMIVLPFLWMCVELLHQDWDMSFPWLNLGYVFANRVTWIQWYELTGIWGGTLWIWWVNAALFTVWAHRKDVRKQLIRRAVWIFVLIALPIVLSVWRYNTYESKGEILNAVVVQPNLDPYETKFNLDALETTEHFLSLAEPYLNENTDYLIGPETMLQGGLDEGQLEAHPAIRTLRKTTEKFPQLHIVTGATTYALYNETDKTETARASDNGNYYYDAFNTSLQVVKDKPIDVYHKSKLVVGVEKLPFAFIFQPLMGEGIDLGGISGTLGIQDEREVFPSSTHPGINIGTIICWEADFGGFTAEFVRNGASVLFAITNDGWWSDTPGKDQHMHYARLRAIENRRSVARSANTGISCLINQRGDVSHVIGWEESGAFAAQIRANNEWTLYSRYGDITGRVALFVSMAVLLSVFVKRKTER